MATYKNWEYDFEEITKSGDDSKTWQYKGNNLDTGKEFNYIIEISKTALSSKGLPTQIQNTVDTKGESLVKELLSENKGYWILANVDTTKIKIKEKKEKYAKLI